MKTRLKYFVYPFIFILLSIPFTIVGEKMLETNLRALKNTNKQTLPLILPNMLYSKKMQRL